MTSRFVIDAHPLIWYIEDNPRLGANARKILADRASDLYLPIIALAEACWVVDPGRSLIPSVADLLRDVDADPRINVVPLDRAVLDRSVNLSAVSEMHDGLIVATALVLGDGGATVSLLTRDNNIALSAVLPVIW
jgi:PIN domain nuclease of toxin-antitoxin system